MEGVVAKRCLRQSSLQKQNNYLYTSRLAKETYSNVYKKNLPISKKISKQEKNNKGWVEKILYNMKTKLWIQSISAMCLAILIFICDLLNIGYIKNNKYVRILKNEYEKNYSITQIKDKTLSVAKYSVKSAVKIVPKKIKNNVKNIYINIKEDFKDKENKNVLVYEEEKTEKEENINNIDISQGIGASIVETEEIEEPVVAVSAISSEDNELKYINDNNIKFVLPTKGTVTSNFGAREVIFADIDPYHTGIDIANKKGTNILASTDGIVTKATYNKYNGNFIEITNGKVVTKYAHMDSLSVKTGTKVNAGDIIGKMGESGYATGPHLHFEVVVDSVKINPAKVVKF